MDFGGIIAGAMAGGGKAIQQKAQGDLAKQREEALAKLEQRMARENLEFEYDKRGEIAEQEAEAAAARQEREAELNRQSDIRQSNLAIAEDAASQSTEARLDSSGGGNDRFNDLYDRAKDRTDRDFKGRVDIASGATYGEEVNTPEYNAMLADSIRREAAAVNDETLRRRLNRQADAIDSGSSQGGGEITPPPLRDNPAR